MNPKKQRIVAIAGGTGLIGRRLVDVLVQTGSSVRILSRRNHPDSPGITFVRGNLTDPSSLLTWISGADDVVHLAGIAHTTLRTEPERVRARAINIDGTKTLLNAARKANVQRVVVTSSAHVYAGQVGVGLREDSPVAADSIYAEMKLQAEAAALQAAANGLHVVIIRPCIVYGPGVSYNLDALMRAVRKGYYVHAGGVDPLRSFASVDTVAAAIAHLLHAGSSGTPYNVADRHPVHLVGWVNGLAERMGVSKPRTLPIGLLRLIAAALTPASMLGLPAPLTNEKLSKLTASFSLDVSALEQTGFAWPETNDLVLNEMIQAASHR